MIVTLHARMDLEPVNKLFGRYFGRFAEKIDLDEFLVRGGSDDYGNNGVLLLERRGEERGYILAEDSGNGENPQEVVSTYQIAYQIAYSDFRVTGRFFDRDSGIACMRWEANGNG